MVEPDRDRLREALRTATSDGERVEILLRASEYKPEEGEPGATDQEIEAFAARLGITVPDGWRAWLRLRNGAIAGYGKFYGMSDIEDTLARFPHLLEYGWLPVGSDGCGSIFVLALQDVTSSGPTVLFLDWEDSDGELFNVASYAVASGLWPFLRLQLMDDLDLIDWHWPFDKERTLQEDPALVESTSAPLPWLT
jgi:hypothetical protein